MIRLLESPNHRKNGRFASLKVRDIEDARAILGKVMNPGWWAGSVMVEAESWSEYRNGNCTRIEV